MSSIKSFYTISHGRRMGQVKGGQLRNEQSRIRTCLFLSANNPPDLDLGSLARFLMPRSPDQRDWDEAESEAYRDAESRLVPLGPKLALVLRDMHSTLAGLLQELEKWTAIILQEHGPFKDGQRRAKAWALVYVGLTVWETATGRAFTTPALDQFVRDVVIPVEESTYARTRTKLAHFSQIFEAHLAKSRHTQEGPVAPGEGRVLARRSLEGRDGWVLTWEFLDGQYNAQCKDRPGLKFESLKEHAAEVAKRFKVPISALLDADGQCKRESLGQKRDRVSFWPNETSETPESFVPLSQASLNRRE